MNVSTIALLLQMAAALLTSLQQNPSLPESSRQQALSLVAQAVQTSSNFVAQGNMVAGASDNWFDYLWKKTFHWQTFFESTAGLTTSGLVVADGNQLIVTADPARGSPAYVLKQNLWQGLGTFSQKSFFRTAFVADQTNETAYIVVGRALNETGDQYYGFKIVNNAIYGVASRNGTANETSVFLQTLVSRIYNVEARYYPGDKVLFYVNPLREDQGSKGTVTTNLPFTTEIPNPELMNIAIQTRDATQKSVHVSFFEYLQERNILQ